MCKGCSEINLNMLPRPCTNLTFSNKELLEFTDNINELVTKKNSNNLTNSNFSTILTTPKRNSGLNGNTNQSPSLRTPLQSKK